MREQDNKRYLVMSEIMPPHAANFSGKVHGGYLMQLLDRVAYACAARYSKGYVVTLSVDQVMFKQPVHVGEMVTFYAAVNMVGRSSMEVGIKVMAENLAEGERRHTNTCYFTMVAVDKNGQPKAIEPLLHDNDTERYREAEAKLRKKARLDYQALHQVHKEKVRSGEANR